MTRGNLNLGSDFYVTISKIIIDGWTTFGKNKSAVQKPI